MNDGRLLLTQKTQPLRHRCRRKNVSANLAGADLFVIVELLINGGDLARYIALVHEPTEDKLIAFLAEPGKLFLFLLAALAFYDQSPGVFEAAWRMRQVAGADKNLSLFDRDDLS